MNAGGSVPEFLAAHRLPFHVLVGDLNVVLSPLQVCAVAGSTERHLPSRWARNGGEVPSETIVLRLRVAHWAWQKLSRISTAEARVWFSTPNRLLGGTTPVTAISEDRFGDVEAAVRARLDAERKPARRTHR